MDARPSVSVIIPTYNRAQIVLRAVRSVLDQTFENLEVVVVDDGSTDSTRNTLNSLSETRFRYVYQAHRGPAAARNIGFSASLGKYIHFLDSDDYFLPKNIEEKIVLLEENYNLGWVYSDCYYTYAKSKNKTLKRLKTRLMEKPDVFELLLMHYFVNTDTVMMRRECFEQVGGFDEDLESFEDMDFFFRLARLYEARLIYTPLVVIDSQVDSVTADRCRFFMGRIRVVEKTKKLFPEETKRIGFPGRCAEADILNYLGTEMLKTRKERMAIKMFMKSIGAAPLQKTVYSLFFLALFRAIFRLRPLLGTPEGPR